MVVLYISSFWLNTFGNLYFLFQKLNPLSVNPGYIRDFCKILEITIFTTFLHLYTKWICGFDAALNFEETGAKKVPHIKKSE